MGECHDVGASTALRRPEHATSAISPMSALGAFLSADSIVPAPLDPQSLNRYAYAGGNPLRFSDPSGHMKLCGAACEDEYKWSPTPRKVGGSSSAGPVNYGGGGGGRSYFGGGNRITGTASIYGPLTRTQWEVSNRAAKVFGLPPELVAGTVAVEITDDTDWYDAHLDLFFQEMPLSYHYSSCASRSGWGAARCWHVRGFCKSVERPKTWCLLRPLIAHSITLEGESYAW